MNINFLFSLLIVLSVQVFVTRILYRDKRTLLFSKKLMTKIGTFYYFFVFLIFFSYFRQPFHLWIISLFSLFVFPVSFYFFKKYRQQQFYGEFIRFLSLVVLQMKMGLALRSSYESALSSSQWTFRGLLGNLFENVVFSQQKISKESDSFALFLGEIIKVLRFFESHPQFAIEGLKKFQVQLVKQTFFRRRSRQIYYQIGSQLVVLSIIYFAVLAYVLFEFGREGNGFIILTSIFLYSLGSLSFFFIGRNKKWNI